MALVNSGNVSNGFFGHRTTQNMLHRSGEYYLFYVDYNGAYWQNVTMENICVVDSDNSDWALQLFNANGVWRNNADSDGTLISGVNHVHNVVSANEFISTTYGASGYLQINTDNSVLGRAGVSPSQNWSI